MTFSIKYKLDSKPKKIKKVSDLSIGIGALLLLVGNFIYTPFKAFPLELQVFAIAEFLTRIILDFNFLSLTVLFLGLILLPFTWRHGKIILETDRIRIEGRVALGLLIERIKMVDVFDATYGIKKTIHLTSDTEKIKLKFRTKLDFECFSSRFVEIAEQYKDMELKAWTD